MKLLVIDGNSIINRAFYGVKSALTNSEGVPTNAVYGFANLLLKTVADYAPDGIVCAFDRREPTFRHEMYSEYKATRKGMPEELAVQMPLLKNLLAAMDITCLELAGYEADDIIGTVSERGREKGVDCIILTGDKDDLQLITENTKVALTVTKNHETVTELMGKDEVIARYGVAPEKLIEVKALMGDSSDNVPGVKGIGEKSAFELIANYGSLEALYENIEDIKGSKKEKRLSDKDMAFLSKTLVTIDKNVPVELDFDKTGYNVTATEKLLSALRYLGFNSIIKKLGAPDESENIKSADAVCKKEVSAAEIIRTFSKSEEIALFLKDDILYFKNGSELLFIAADKIGEAAQIIENENIKKVTFGLKELYRLCLKKDIVLRGAEFDAETAVYLLNPSASGYTLSGAVYELLKTECQHDADCAVKLFELKDEAVSRLERLNMEKLYREIELPLTKVLAEMEHRGFMADKAALLSYGERLGVELSELTEAIYTLAGREFNINSPKQLGEILFEELGLKSRKKTKSGYSTDAATLEKLKGVHPIVELILQYRGVAKLKSTYADGLLKQIADDGRIHSTFLQTVTQTGRISSKEPNLQNIPVRKEEGRELRKMFIAKEGYSLIDGDYSQIELRVLADIARDPEMQDAFLHDEDIHTKTAAEVFNMHPAFVTPLMRTRAKAVNFGIVYGIGDYSLSEDLKISVSEARSYIKSYLETYHGVAEYMEKTVSKAKEKGFVTTAFNRIRYIPELSAANKNIVAFGERVARNTPIQGTAADIIKIAMIRVSDRFEKENMQSRLILQIHDELIAECPDTETERAAAIMKEEMENAASLSVPLKVDINAGKSWFDAK